MYRLVDRLKAPDAFEALDAFEVVDVFEALDAVGTVDAGGVPDVSKGPLATGAPAKGSLVAETPAKGSLARLACVFLAAVLALALMGNTFAQQNFAYADETDNNLVDPTQRADNSFIYDTTVESLFTQASLYNDRTVQVVGEVIGDRIETNDGTGTCWITLTSVYEDNASTISVLLSADQANQIDRYGRYGVTGTTLQVRGTYHQTCSEHDGLPDIHATTSSVMARGVDHPDEFVLGDFVPGILALAIGFALLGAYYFARERMR